MTGGAPALRTATRAMCLVLLCLVLLCLVLLCLSRPGQDSPGQDSPGPTSRSIEQTGLTAGPANGRIPATVATIVRASQGTGAASAHPTLEARLVLAGD
jgi:hypothetical protein